MIYTQTRWGDRGALVSGQHGQNYPVIHQPSPFRDKAIRGWHLAGFVRHPHPAKAVEPMYKGMYEFPAKASLCGCHTKPVQIFRIYSTDMKN